VCKCFDKYVAVTHIVVYASKQLNATDIVCFSKVNRFNGAVSAAPPEHELHNFCQGMRGKLLMPRELYIIWDCTVLSVGFRDDFIKDCTLPFSEMTSSRIVLSAIFRDDFIKDCRICQFQR